MEGIADGKGVAKYQENRVAARVAAGVVIESTVNVDISGKVEALVAPLVAVFRVDEAVAGQGAGQQGSLPLSQYPPFGRQQDGRREIVQAFAPPHHRIGFAPAAAGVAELYCKAMLRAQDACIGSYRQGIAHNGCLANGVAIAVEAIQLAGLRPQANRIYVRVNIPGSAGIDVYLARLLQHAKPTRAPVFSSLGFLPAFGQPGLLLRIIALQAAVALKRHFGLRMERKGEG